MKDLPRMNLTLSDVAVDPGAELQVTCMVEPWPDPKGKARQIELELVYQCDRLESIKSAGVLDAKPRDLSVRNTVSTVEIPASQVEPSGRCTGSFLVPHEGPPTSLGFRATSWMINGRLVGRFGVHSSAEFEVGMPTLEHVLAARIPADDSHDRYGSIPGSTVSSGLTLVVESGATERGDILRGDVTLQLNPMDTAKTLVNQGVGSVTKRGRRRLIEELAEVDLSEVEITSGELILESWWCGPKGNTAIDLPFVEDPNARIWHEPPRVLLARLETDISLPDSLEAGSAHVFPFEIHVPRSFRPFWKMNDEDLPPTWYGQHTESDDFVWRLSAIVNTHPVNLPISLIRATSHWNLVQALEVIIT